MMPDQVRKWLRQVNRLLFCGFRRNGKAMGRSVSILAEDLSRNKCLSFSRFKYRVFYVLYPFVTYLLALPRAIATVRTNLQSDAGALGINWWNVFHQVEKVRQTLTGPSGMNAAWTEIEIRVSHVSIPISLLPTGYSRFPFCFGGGGAFVVFIDRLMEFSPACREVSVSSSCDTFHISSVISRWFYFTSTEIYCSAYKCTTAQDISSLTPDNCNRYISRNVVWNTKQLPCLN
jgi:hypothetical protein